MTTLLFIHGMNGTAENWTDIPDRLAPHVDRADAVQLPGHDTKITIPEALLGKKYTSGLSMADYVSAVADAFPPGSARDVVLVGHSMGGAVISHVAAAYPERIAKLIYMAAMLPADGQSAADILDWIKNSGTVNPIGFLGDFKKHKDKLHAAAQPEEPMAEPFSLTSDYEALPRAYIRCTEDDVIPIENQDKMIEGYSDTKIVTLNLSHFPQFDDAEKLASTIKALLPV